MYSHDFVSKYRNSVKMTQEAVASYAGISRAHYANIERGVRRPSPKIAQKIGGILRFDWRLFYEEKNNSLAPMGFAVFTQEV